MSLGHWFHINHGLLFQSRVLLTSHQANTVIARFEGSRDKSLTVNVARTDGSKFKPFALRETLLEVPSCLLGLSLGERVSSISINTHLLQQRHVGPDGLVKDFSGSSNHNCSNRTGDYDSLASVLVGGSEHG